MPWRTSVLNEHFVLLQTPCQSNQFWCYQLPLKMCAASVEAARASINIHMCLWQSGVDALSIFSPVHWVLPLCSAALFLRTSRRVISSRSREEYRENSSSAPWPRSSDSYISGRDLQGGGQGRLSAKKIGAFLMDAMFIHLFLSGVTNGLIIQLSHWHVISHFLMGRIPPWNISAIVSGQKKRYARLPKLFFKQ